MGEPRSWPPREEWAALRSGVNCPMCAVIPDVDEYGHTIARLSGSVLRLAADQFTLGYCVLICTRHGPEPYSLDAEEAAAFFADLARSGAALERAFGADKLNFLMLGNSAPHLHAHLVPRYHGDLAPGAPYFPDGSAPVRLTPAEYQERVARVRAALE